MSAMSANVSQGSKLTRTISVTSGKGGVGKTSLVVNLATTFARKGHCVLILDGDLGMANVDIMFGARPAFTIRDCINGTKRIEDVLQEVDPNIFLIPGGSGLKDLQNISDMDKRNLLDQLGGLRNRFDYMLIDTAPGITDNVTYFNASAQEIVVVLTPDPSSLTDAYALIKVLNKYHKETRFSIVTNCVRDEQEGMALYQKLCNVTEKFLYVSLDYLGHVPMDLSLRRATKNQQILVRSNPEASASSSIRKIAGKLSTSQNSGQLKGGMQFFWEQLMGVA